MFADRCTLASEAVLHVMCPDVFRQPLVWKFPAEKAFEAESATELALQIGDPTDNECRETSLSLGNFA